MPKVPFDFSFAREGRPLSAWLRDLVGHDRAPRLTAGEVLDAMMYGYPSAQTNSDDLNWGSADDRSDEQSCRFLDAIRAAVAAPDFPAADFVQRLIARRIALAEGWRRRIEFIEVRDSASLARGERLARRIRDATDNPGRARAERLHARWLRARIGRGERPSRSIPEVVEESFAEAGMMSSTIFEALDAPLLADRPGLRRMLADPDLFRDAADALARIGPPALDFAGFFLDRLDAGEQPYTFDGAHALGSIARDDPTTIDGFLHRLREGKLPARIGAVQSLEHAGPPLAGRLETAIPLLLDATHVPDLTPFAIGALASVGRDREEALRRVLELVGPRSSPRADADAMPERGAAIDALAHFRRFADRVVPFLIEAFDTFEEYNPDLGYYGEHARVCAALIPFGPAAAPALPRLIRSLDERSANPIEGDALPTNLMLLIEAIGPAAAPTRPALERLREGTLGEDEDTAPLDPNHLLDHIILTLRHGIP